MFCWGYHNAWILSEISSPAKDRNCGPPENLKTPFILKQSGCHPTHGIPQASLRINDSIPHICAISGLAGSWKGLEGAILGL